MPSPVPSSRDGGDPVIRAELEEVMETSRQAGLSAGPQILCAPGSRRLSSQLADRRCF